MKFINLLIVTATMAAGLNSALAQEPNTTTVISDLSLLKALNIPVVYSKEGLNLGVALATPEQRLAISHAAHERGACAGYKAILQRQSFGPQGYEALLAPIEKRILKNQSQRFSFQSLTLKERPEISKLVARVDEGRLRSSVEWFSAFHNRYHNSPNCNDHVNEMKAKIEQMLATSKLKYSVELINHVSTPQKSLRVRLHGAERPNEVVVLGGHFDSIMFEGIFGRPNPKGRAPGADDNASGSSSILEALRLIAEHGQQPKRTIDFIWYAAEEVGLYGSQEIAAQYRRNNVDVIGVLQLDMNLYPGNGELTIASMTDYTSPWLRSVFVELNRLYIGAKIINSMCGYGCSDHASWHDQGYPTLMPSESDMRSMNHNIHTEHDVINHASSFKHMAAFAKTAVAFAMELGNSTLREP